MAMASGSPEAPVKWVGMPVAMMKCGWKQTSTKAPPGRASRRASAYSGASDGRCSSTSEATTRS